VANDIVLVQLHSCFFKAERFASLAAASGFDFENSASIPPAPAVTLAIVVFVVCGLSVSVNRPISSVPYRATGETQAILGNSLDCSVRS
jgi:hypothetical protein